jgi:RNA polymerase sigma factor (sigma-70 family)
MRAFTPSSRGEDLTSLSSALVTFDEALLPHMVEAYRFARWLTGTASGAEEVVLDAALRAFRGVENFSGVNARARFLTIVHNAAYNWLMKNRPKAAVLTDDLSIAEQSELEQGPQGARIETPEEIALFKAEAENVRRAMEQLPTHFREVIVLREINQMNYRDIAEITDVPISKVMSRLTQGRQFLVALLEGRWQSSLSS